MNVTFKLALLHMVYMLVHADGVVDERELAMLQRIREEESISDAIFNAFESRLSFSSEKELFDHSIRLMAQCTDDEKLRIFAYLYKLAESDNDLNMREVRLLFYALEQTKIEFDDVLMIARMAS